MPLFLEDGNISISKLSIKIHKSKTKSKCFHSDSARETMTWFNYPSLRSKQTTTHTSKQLTTTTTNIYWIELEFRLMGRLQGSDVSLAMIRYRRAFALKTMDDPLAWSKPTAGLKQTKVNVYNRNGKRRGYVEEDQDGFGVWNEQALVNWNQIMAVGWIKNGGRDVRWWKVWSLQLK